MGNLTAVGVKALKTAGVYGDGQGLYLQVSGAVARSWIFRYQRLGKRREMGLGSLDDVTLAEARRKAQDARKLIDGGNDPIAVREALRDAQRLAEAQAITFKQAAEAYIEIHKATWRSAKHRWQWGKSLEDYVYPYIGSMAVGAIGVADVRRVLEPIWLDMPTTGSRIRGRIETVINAARADDESRWSNPARWERHKHVFPTPAKVRKVQHRPALPYAEVPALMKQLAGFNRQSVSSMALRFTILTAARTGEVIGMQWPELDKEAKLWVCPPERMKAEREHRVPLSDAALAIIKEMEKVRLSPLVFPGWRKEQPLSDMAMIECLRRLRSGVTVHGFRSSFRDWAGEETDHPHDICEAALAHIRRDKTHAAYQRGDLFKKRRQLMADWATFCGQ